MWNTMIQKAVALPTWCYGAAAFIGVLVMIVALNNQQTPVPPPQPNGNLFTDQNPAIPLPAAPAVGQIINTVSNVGNNAAKEGEKIMSEAFDQTKDVLRSTRKVGKLSNEVLDAGISKVRSMLPKDAKAGNDASK